MQLKVLGTGSTGNCYVLKASDGQMFALDLGLKKDEIIKGIDYKLNNLVGAFVTHAHSDHARSVDAIRAYGVKVIANYCKDYTPSFLALTERYSTDICGYYQLDWFPNKNREGKWFHSNGDGSECPCYGAVIRHKEMGLLLYLTDTELCPWNFKAWQLDYILVECNYQDKYVDDLERKTSHVYSGHMELQTVIDFVKANKTDNLKKVIICHMSATNANPEEMKAAIEEAAGVEVEIAEKDKIIDL